MSQNADEPRAPLFADRADAIDIGFAWLQRWALRIVAIAAAAFVIFWVLGQTWTIWYPVALALVVATVLAPPTTWLRRHGWPSGLAAATVMLGFLGSLAGVIAILTPQVAGEAPELADQASKGVEQVRDWLVDGPLDVSEAQIDRAVEAIQDKLESSASTITAGVFSTVSAATSVVINIVVILILTFLFIKDGHRFLPWIKSVSGTRSGDHLVEVLNRVWNTLGGFIRTQSLVALIDAVLIGIALAAVGNPLAIPLAVLTFIGGFIPIIGAFVSGALAVLVTLVTNSTEDTIIVLVVVILVQQLEGNVLSPWLQGKTMNLHAAVVLLAVMAGGSMFGITGAFLAVPVAATTAEILRYVNEQIQRSVEAIEEATDEEPAET